MYKINDLYDLTHSQAKDYLSKYEYPWQALKGIKDFIIELGETLGDEYQEVNEHVWIHKFLIVLILVHLVLLVQEQK